jgi:4-oxalocrotonate tautomerase
MLRDQFSKPERKNLKEANMPVVQVYLYKGRSKEVKKELVRRISKDFQEVANIAPESLHVLFHDMEKDDWGTKGTLASELTAK